MSLTGGALELLDIPGEPGAAPLILMHEGLGSVRLWRGFPGQLAAATGRRTVVFSRFGHGQSDPPPTRRTPAFMHEEALALLPELLAALAVDQPVLVGHSDGASIALIYAAHHPVRAVVAIAPHVFVEDVCLREIERARQVYLDGDLRQRMARHHRDPDAAFFGWNDVWLDPEFTRWDITAEVERITCPLLLIQGEHDQYGTMAQLDAIEQRARGPVRRVHLECQHSPPTEKPQETVEAIAHFLVQLPDDHLPEDTIHPSQDPITIVEEPFNGPGGTALVPEYVAVIRSLYPGWTPDVSPRLTPEDVEPPSGRWLVAYRGVQPVGTAALKRLDNHTGEIKRVYVVPEARGAGVARALVARLEEIARTIGYAELRLDTGSRQPESVALFSSLGYEPIPDYNGNPVAAHWFEKRLT
ncbi:MAG: alpha/beta fold hydrolase [Solirubrobacterales bacterium]|nr:alpha/beta fold hydrolase [Solirubrobacterales bacterium]